MGLCRGRLPSRTAGTPHRAACASQNPHPSPRTQTHATPESPSSYPHAGFCLANEFGAHDPLHYLYSPLSLSARRPAHSRYPSRHALATAPPPTYAATDAGTPSAANEAGARQYSAVALIKLRHRRQPVCQWRSEANGSHQSRLGPYSENGSWGERQLVKRHQLESAWRRRANGVSTG